MLYKTAVVGIVDALVDCGMSIVYMEKHADKPNERNLIQGTVPDSAGVEVINATGGGIWKGEIPESTLTDVLDRFGVSA